MGADISKHDVVKKKEKVFRTNETCAKLDVVYYCSICDNSVMGLLFNIFSIGRVCWIYEYGQTGKRMAMHLLRRRVKVGTMAKSKCIDLPSWPKSIVMDI